MFRNKSESSTLILLAVSAVQFIVSVDLSIVNVGLPEIADGLGFSAAGLTWVIHAYALTFGGLLLLGGKAADRLGHKRVLLFGLTLFGVASFAGGLAVQPFQLVAARALQGVGAAAVAPAALAVLTETFPSGRRRARAFGIWAAMNAAGGALGVLMGGVLTEFAGWRWVMFVNLPMAAIALTLVSRGVRSRTAPRARGRVDVIGGVLVTAGMGLLVFGIIGIDGRSWHSPRLLLPLIMAVGLLAAFIRVEQTTRREPLIRLGIFADRVVAGANVYNLLIGAAMASAFYFMSLYMQRALDYGPAITGVLFLPFALGVVAGSVLAAKLGSRMSGRALLVAGALATATGFAWFAAIDPDGSFVADVLGPSLIASTGFGLCLGPLVSLATAGVEANETGVASALLNCSRQIGASLGLAVLGTIAAATSGASDSPAALTSGYSRGLLLSSILLVVAAMVAGVTLRVRTAGRDLEASRV